MYVCPKCKFQLANKDDDKSNNLTDTNKDNDE